MAMGSRLIMGGELLMESEAESVVRSLFVMLESSLGCGLVRLDWSMLRSWEKENWSAG